MAEDKTEEGHEAFMENVPISDCPYTDAKSVEAWKHGWKRGEEELGSA